jgi:hypothetical protein
MFYERGGIFLARTFINPSLEISNLEHGHLISTERQQKKEV